VQEYAASGDLFENLKRCGGQLKEKHCVRDVIDPFLQGLMYLHSMVRARARSPPSN
jgi:aurora kinase